MADKCEHKVSRLWDTPQGPKRRCRDCGRLQKLTPVDEQLLKK